MRKNPSRPAPANAVFFATTKGDGHQIIVVPEGSVGGVPVYDFGVYSGGEKWWSGSLDANAVRQSIQMELPNQKYVVKVDKLTQKNPRGRALFRSHGKNSKGIARWSTSHEVNGNWIDISKGDGGVFYVVALNGTNVAAERSLASAKAEGLRLAKGGTPKVPRSSTYAKSNPSALALTLKDQHGRSVQLPWRTAKDGRPGNESIALRASFYTDPNDATREWVSGAITRDGKVIATWPRAMRAGKTIKNPAGKRYIEVGANVGDDVASFLDRKGLPSEVVKHRGGMAVIEVAGAYSSIAKALGNEGSYKTWEWFTTAKPNPVKNPRYASGPYTEKVKVPGFYGKTGLEHATAPRVRAAFPGADHITAIEKAIVHANAAARAYNRTMKAAIAKHGEPHPWISGIGSESFPDATKKLLRKQLDAFNRAQDAVALHYKALGKRTPFYKSEYAHRLVKAGGYGLGSTKSNPTPFYGAPMGYGSRSESPDATATLLVRRVKLDSGGYASDGAYFGIGRPVYVVTNAETGRVVETLRAADFVDAKEKMRSKYPNAKVK